MSNSEAEPQAEVARLKALVQSMREALEWYSERVGLVGAWSVEGAKARAELTADNGQMAALADGQAKP